MGQNATINANFFLVCGLGNLGQYCVSVLKEFGAKVNAIEITTNQRWEIPDLPDLVDDFIIGDCRQPKILEQAGIKNCRAILIVTSNERVNIAAAFAARSLNPQIRLVIRSAQENLNELLSHNLGNFVAFEATQLPAKSFALAALSSETRSFFTLENHLLRVFRTQIDASHPWAKHSLLSEINTAHRRILAHAKAGNLLPQAFHKWEPNTQVLPGDTVAYIEVNDPLATRSIQPASSRQQFLPTIMTAMKWQNIHNALLQFWEESSQIRRVVLVGGMFMVSLFLCGTLLYKLQYPQLSFQDALNVSLVLSIGGYDNLFGQLQLPFKIPWWLHLFSISQTVAGTVFVGILYAVMTERVLAAKFQFSQRRLPIPKADHVVLIGLGRVGQRVAQLLQELKQPLVGVTANEIDPGTLSTLPLIQGNIKNALSKVNLNTAKSVLVVTDDEVANLEIALMTHASNPTANLVIRTLDPGFSENVAKLLPYARVLGVYALAAEAFVAAAFGENVLNLFRLNNQTTLVTEYQIETNDTLNGKLLGEIAYGYGIVPILHVKATQQIPKFMPSDDIRLAVGDRLIVLATIAGLQRVERGSLAPPQLLVRVESAFSPEAAFEGAAVMARVSGCDMQTARTLMKQLPATLQYPLYKHQAHRLVSELGKSQVLAHIV
ncbi:TrkA-N domain protein [Tolypothrix tenuis PCC 7101]|uniref:TrkA-N domain protein n=1 Tax=Tolypothrix tenuis PCC 7101 TaxID=231146 RepID=A0A1Z4MZU9_9CYAN|nr:NAD-binding protein [Aulosira sp. FACHB-113]BAY99002.1 TrkA-N domain protein [Tolypothrix tenuis PCC 7101]BAZ77078.1 TrkA-N domain protein [Aulosira laxa NIES-50]